MARDTANIAPAPAGLTYVNDDDTGLTRIAAKEGFAYRDSEGRPVTDEATLARIKALVIPPAWTDLWICPSASKFLEAARDSAS